jgi:hypothetical protein
MTAGAAVIAVLSGPAQAARGKTKSELTDEVATLKAELLHAKRAGAGQKGQRILAKRRAEARFAEQSDTIREQNGVLGEVREMVQQPIVRGAIILSDVVRSFAK